MLILALLSLVAWLVVVLHRAPPRTLLPEGDTVDAPDPERWPSVAIIVPARNEEAMLPLTLPRLLAQDYPGAKRVIVVDERSSDRTADVVRGFEGVELVQGDPLPDGWVGKVWGMQQGLRKAGVLDARDDAPDFVLFTDADIAHEPSSLRTLVREATARGLDLDSRMAMLRCESNAEKLLIPAFLFFFATMYPMRRVADPSDPMAASAGGCQLVRSSMLRAMNGVEPIAPRRIDDVSLAREMKSRGARLNLSCSSTLVRSLREYPRVADVWRMVRRNAFEELRFSWLRLVACLLALGLVFVVPFAAWVSGNVFAMLAGAAALLLSTHAYLPAIRHFRLDREGRRATSLPFVGILYGAMTIDSALRHAMKRETAWRGEMTT